jgi:hypothetical protein
MREQTMTFALTSKADPARVAADREANDKFRKTLTGGAVMLSAGVIALGDANQARIIAAIRAFDDFDGADPWDAHDVGDLVVEVDEPGIARWLELIFFRIDQPDPASAHRLLTIMLASEW